MCYGFWLDYSTHVATIGRPFLSTFPSCLTTDLSLLRHQVVHVAKQSIGDLPKTPRMYSPMWCCGVAYARHVKRPRGGWRQCIFFRRPQGRRFLPLLAAWPTWLACTIGGFFRLVESSCRPHSTILKDPPGNFLYRILGAVHIFYSTGLALRPL